MEVLEDLVKLPVEEQGLDPCPSCLKNCRLGPLRASVTQPDGKAGGALEGFGFDGKLQNGWIPCGFSLVFVGFHVDSIRFLFGLRGFPCVALSFDFPLVSRWLPFEPR